MAQERKILCREELNNGFFVVVDSNFEYNIERSDGTLLSEEWFDFVYDFYDGVCIVRKHDKKEYYLREDGTFISDVGYPSVSPFASGMGTVRKENLSWDWILPNGELFFKKWVKEAHPDFLSPLLHVVFEDDTTAIYDERDNSVEYHNKEESL